jgi:hypothetical protein
MSQSAAIGFRLQRQAETQEGLMPDETAVLRFGLSREVSDGAVSQRGRGGRPDAACVCGRAPSARG